MNKLLINSLMTPAVMRLVWESAVCAFEHTISINMNLSGKTYQIFPEPWHTMFWKSMDHTVHFRVITGIF